MNGYDYTLIELMLQAVLALSRVGEQQYRSKAPKPEIWDRRHQMLESLAESYRGGNTPR